MKDLTQKQTHGIQFSTPWIDRYYRGWGGGPQPFLGSITLFPFKYLSSPILSLFLPLMVMPKVVLINSGQKLCFFAHLALYLHNAIMLVSRVLRDSIPRFVHPSVGRSFGRLVGPRFTFWHFCRHGWVNSLLSLRILLKSKIDVWAKYKYPISNINTSTHSIYVILGLIWLSWGQWRAEGKFWPRDSWFCLEKHIDVYFIYFGVLRNGLAGQIWSL